MFYEATKKVQQEVNRGAKGRWKRCEFLRLKPKRKQQPRKQSAWESTLNREKIGQFPTSFRPLPTRIAMLR